MKGKLLRGLLLAVALTGLALLCSGCMFKPVDDLYTLPALPEGYSELESTIQSVMNELGAEYATINAGGNTSTVQLLDMNGDGEQETAAAFFRVPSAEEKPLRVCLFRKGSDDVYRLAYMVSGDGTSINSVAYEDLTGDGYRELVVSWQMSAGVHILSVYQLGSSGAQELVNTTYNESYLITDLDGDRCQELVVIQQSSTGESSSRAEYYDYQEQMMLMTSAANLSNGIRDVLSVKTGRLADGSSGIYAMSAIEGGVLTDILILEHGGLVNVTRDQDSGISSATTQTYTDVTVTDINRDGILEVPFAVPVASLQGEEEQEMVISGASNQFMSIAASSTYYIIYWRQFDRAGNAATSCVTYHSVSDGWYLMLPNNWTGSITLERDDSLSSRGERSVVFYYLPQEDEDGEPVPFLTIYRLTGNNREARSKMSGRTVLRNDGSTIYAAILDPEVWDCGVSIEEIGQRFYLITTEWST